MPCFTQGSTVNKTSNVMLIVVVMLIGCHVDHLGCHVDCGCDFRMYSCK